MWGSPGELCFSIGISFCYVRFFVSFSFSNLTQFEQVELITVNIAGVFLSQETNKIQTYSIWIWIKFKIDSYSTACILINNLIVVNKLETQIEKKTTSDEKRWGRIRCVRSRCKFKTKLKCWNESTLNLLFLLLAGERSRMILRPFSLSLNMFGIYGIYAMVCVSASASVRLCLCVDASARTRKLNS